MLTTFEEFTRIIDPMAICHAAERHPSRRLIVVPTNLDAFEAENAEVQAVCYRHDLHSEYRPDIGGWLVQYAAMSDLRTRTPGQIAYEAECQTYPNYHDGTPRKTWAQLKDYEQATWEKNPKPRVFKPFIQRARPDARSRGNA